MPADFLGTSNRTYRHLLFVYFDVYCKVESQIPGFCLLFDINNKLTRGNATTTDAGGNTMSPPYDIDLGYWRCPEGVAVPDDELSFLLVPDDVEAAIVFDLARQVHAYQRQHVRKPEQISKAVMVTMGGLLPGVLLYDHLVQGIEDGVPEIEFGTIGVSLYKEPGKRWENPMVVQDVSIPVEGTTTLVIDDLGDYGGTMDFVVRIVKNRGAYSVLTLELYTKPAAKKARPATFAFGEVPQDTWIITPRERVETLMKRVPLWKQRGASFEECHRRLVDLIGYPTDLVGYYLPFAYGAIG
jgi:hypoxanthine phosphoribosyltransferase